VALLVQRADVSGSPGLSESEPFRIFVSYSRHDARLVGPVVQLLRATRGVVFQDVDSLHVGRLWRPQINEAIRQAHLVAVFWCWHSNASSEVRKEYKSAIARRKEVMPPLPDVMPVLLDSTPLPKSLGGFHGIDFRVVGEGEHAMHRQSNVLHPPGWQTWTERLREEWWERERQKRQRLDRERREHAVVAIASGLQPELLRRLGGLRVEGMI
jgi:TIR domain